MVRPLIRISRDVVCPIEHLKTRPPFSVGESPRRIQETEQENAPTPFKGLGHDTSEYGNARLCNRGLQQYKMLLDLGRRSYDGRKQRRHYGG